jgi:hypothetical protein
MIPYILCLSGNNLNVSISLQQPNETDNINVTNLQMRRLRLGEAKSLVHTKSRRYRQAAASECLTPKDLCPQGHYLFPSEMFSSSLLLLPAQHMRLAAIMASITRVIRRTQRFVLL